MWRFAFLLIAGCGRVGFAELRGADGGADDDGAPGADASNASANLVFVTSTEPMRTGVPGSWFLLTRSPMTGGCARGATARALSSHVVRSLKMSWFFFVAGS